MKKQLILGLVMVFSWAAATFFTQGITTVVDENMTRYHHKALTYIGVSFLFLLSIIYLTVDIENPHSHIGF